LYHDVDDYLEGHGDIKYVYLFSSLALLTLLIACMNFMNLSTARSVARAREVGVRKVVGARRADVIRQFLGESSLVALLALVLALVLAEVLLPFINNWSGKQLSLMSSTNTILLIYMAGLVFVSGVIAGYYPAFVLSSFKPAETVKGTGRARGSGRWFRRVLVILQFGMAGVLILAAVIIYKQMDFVRNRSLGFDKEHMVYFVSRGEYTTNYESIRERLLAHPAIAGVTAGRPPVRSPGSASDIWWDGQGAQQEGRWSSLALRRNYIETFDMNIVRGQDFTKESSSEVSREFVVNQAACRVMGVDSPIGRQFKFSRHNFDGNALEKTSYEGTIVGVVQDFHFGPLYNPITPVVMFVDEAQARHVSVRINAGMTAEAMTLLKDYWQRYAPDRIFEYHFVDESLDSFYQAEVQLSRILYSYTILAIFLSCLGLFGLSSFMAQQRTTEIGVRKVLGSSVAGVVHLLIKELVLLVAVANVFAWPIAWYVMGRWLEKFVYRIEIDIGTFFLAGSAAMLITLVTVSFQAIKAARANPVEALRYE
jgi:putative ABC transport system permease protein